MWIETIVLFSIIFLVISIMIVLTVETLHTTKVITKKRKQKYENKRLNNN